MTRMTRMTGPDCAVYVQFNKYTYIHGNEDGIGEGGREAKKRKKPQNS